MADEYIYRVVLKDGCRRSKASGRLREGDPLWLFGGTAPGTPPPMMLWRVDEVLPPVHEGEDGEVVVSLWTGEPPRLA
jgi:hypothetical protein